MPDERKLKRNPHWKEVHLRGEGFSKVVNWETGAILKKRSVFDLQGTEKTTARPEARGGG